MGVVLQVGATAEISPGTDHRPVGEIVLEIDPRGDNLMQGAPRGGLAPPSGDPKMPSRRGGGALRARSVALLLLMHGGVRCLEETVTMKENGRRKGHVGMNLAKRPSRGRWVGIQELGLNGGCRYSQSRTS